MTKNVLTSSGKLIDLDSDNEVQNLPPESLVMDKRTYGSYPPSFYAPFKGKYCTIYSEYTQWFSSDSGRTLLAKELAEMGRFPFETSLKQDRYAHDLSYLTIIKVNGVAHEVLMTYDRDHPDFEMQVTILSPTLNMGRMPGHAYGQNKPCYIDNWSRKFRAIHVAMQVTSWLDDYYKGTYFSGYGSSNVLHGSNNFLERLQRDLDFYRRY